MAILKRRATKAAAGLASVAAGISLLEAPAAAQLGGFGFICAILNNLAASVPFLAPFLSGIAAFFGCTISLG